MFSFARRSGRGEDQVMDDVQDFFHHLLVNKRVGRADPALGKFRTFLLTVFKRFLIDKWRRGKMGEIDGVAGAEAGERRTRGGTA